MLDVDYWYLRIFFQRQICLMEIIIIQSFYMRSLENLDKIPYETNIVACNFLYFEYILLY